MWSFMLIIILLEPQLLIVAEVTPPSAVQTVSPSLNLPETPPVDTANTQAVSPTLNLPETPPVVTTANTQAATETPLPDPCYPDPCQNGASCILIGDNNFTCLCMAGFTGMKCENVYCDPIVISNCPTDIHKLVPELTGDYSSTSVYEGSPIPNSVTWTPPTAVGERTERCAIVIPTANRYPWSTFPVGLTTVVYNFTDVGGNFESCSFDVNITEVSCLDNEFQCRSGRCIDRSLVCDNYPDCIDAYDEFRCQIEEGDFYGPCGEVQNRLSNQMQRSCSTEEQLPHVKVEIPRKKREAFDEDLGRRRWRFYTGQFHTETKVFLWFVRFETELYDTSKTNEPTAEFKITLRTSRSGHEAVIYQAGYDIFRRPEYLRSPLELLPDEDIDVTVTYTPDPLNVDPYPVELVHLCPECVSVTIRRLTHSPCADLEMCLSYFYPWLEDPHCLPEEVANVYKSSFGNVCHDKPAIVYITPNQEGDPDSNPVELQCLATGIPPPIVTWVDEDGQPAKLTTKEQSINEFSDYLIQATTCSVSVGDKEKRYFCKYESPNGSGISQAVVVKPRSPICMELNRNQTLVQGRNVCSGGTTIRGRLSNIGRSVFEMQFVTDDLSNYDGNALIHSISIPGDVFRQIRESGPVVTSVVLALFEDVGQRFKRSVDKSAIYRMTYVDVFMFSPTVVFNIDIPNFITRYSEYGSSSRVRVSLGLRGWEFKRGIEFEAQAHLKISLCSNLEYGLHEVQTNCSLMYNEWTRLVENSKQYGCESNSYTLYQKCIKEVQYNPILTSTTPQKSVVIDAFSDGRGLQCPIKHAARIEWRKLEKESEAIVERVTGNVLLFQRFQAEDQGAYICIGYGSGMHDGAAVKSSPALVVLKGASTFIATIVFPDYGYSDDFGQNVLESSSVPEVYELEGWFYNAWSLLQPPADEPQNLMNMPLFSVEGTDVLSAFPANNGTGFETAIYLRKSRTNITISDVNLIEMFNKFWTENVEGIEFESLGSGDISTLDIYNIGSCPEEQTELPFVLTWAETQVGQVAESVEQCPEYSGKSGARATRECVGDLISTSKWKETIVNDCFEDETTEVNQVISFISKSIVTEENVTEVAVDLSEVTNDTMHINATGLEEVAVALEKIVNVQSPSPEVTSSVVDTIDNVLNIDDDIFRATVDKNTPTRILRSLEEQLTALQKQGESFNRSRPNIEVNAMQFPQSSVSNGIGFANLLDTRTSDGGAEVFADPDDIPVNDADTSIALPPEVITQFRNQVGSTASVPATFILYQNSKLFQSRRLRQETTPDITRVVGTRIISATIEGIKVNNLPTDQQIVSTYLHTKEEDENTTLDNFQCVFWDFDLEDGNGDWSNEGCMLVETSGSGRSVCHCDHLTSFAVLIDVHGQKYSLLALDVLSIIGCFISITALLIILVTYLSTKSLRTKTPKKILICLSATLLCLYVVFVAGIDRATSSSGCAFVAALLHYLTLSSVCWMGVEAVNLYLLIVKVFNADVSHFMLKACLAAWGGPLIPVLIVLAADYTQYINEHHCFMKASYGFYFADLSLIVIILAANIVVFAKILHKLTCGRNKSLVRSSDRDKKQSVTRALNSLAICSVLGLTWVFGFLTVFENRASSLIFQVLFCLFNSLQGLFIFVLFCVRPEEVRAVWKRWLGLSGKGNHGGFVSSTDGRSHGTRNVVASSRSENVELSSKSQSAAPVSNGQKEIQLHVPE